MEYEEILSAFSIPQTCKDQNTEKGFWKISVTFGKDFIMKIYSS